MGSSTSMMRQHLNDRAKIRLWYIIRANIRGEGASSAAAFNTA